MRRWFDKVNKGKNCGQYIFVCTKYSALASVTLSGDPKIIPFFIAFLSLNCNSLNMTAQVRTSSYDSYYTKEMVLYLMVVLHQQIYSHIIQGELTRRYILGF